LDGLSYVKMKQQNAATVSLEMHPCKLSRYYTKGTKMLMSFADGTKINANVGTTDGTANSNKVLNKTWLTKM